MGKQKVTGDYALDSMSNNNRIYVDRETLVSLIRITKNRNTKLYNTLVRWYEHLEQKKFDETVLQNF